MKEKRLHRLLKRQLSKVELTPEILEELTEFLALVNDAYHSFQNDFIHLEHVLEQSSKELFETNQKLKLQVEDVEIKLNRLVTNISDVVFEMDTKGRWTYLNSAWESMSGYTVEESIGKSCFDFASEEFVDTLKEKLENFTPDFVIINNELKYKRPDGKIIWLIVSLKPMLTKDNFHEGFIGTITDISELKKTEEKLIELRERAEKANIAKDDFLSTMSHEIRTPLNAIIGVNNLLLMENPKPSQLENLNVLKYSSEHLLALVNDILDYNKILADSITLEKTEFDLERLLKAQYEIFAIKAKNKNLNYRFNLEPNIPKILKGDALRLGQVLTNLINNALKFTNEGGVILNIALKSKDEKSCVLIFEVIDTGIGIPKAKIKKIFNPFTQANSATTRLYGGTGLGLSISKQLVEIMEGDLSCASIMGRGSTFEFELPFEFGSIEEFKKKDNSINQLLTFENKQLRSLKCLVVEDNKVNVFILCKYLKQWGVKYEVSENGLEGFKMSNEKHFDFILMDIEMPVMNGFLASYNIRKSKENPNNTTPIIALTASTRADLQEDLIKYKIDDMMNKPFNPKELYQLIRKHVGVNVKE